MNDVTAEAEEAAEEVPAEEIKRNNIDDILLSMSLAQKEAAIAAVLGKKVEAEPQPVKAAESHVEEVAEVEPETEVELAEKIVEVAPEVEPQVEEVAEAEPEEAAPIEKVIEEVAEPEETPQVEEVVEAEQEVEVQPIEEVAEVSQAEPETEVKEDAAEGASAKKAALGNTRDIAKEIEAELEKQAAELEKQEKEKQTEKEKEEKKEAASVKEEDAVPTDLTEEQKYNFSYFATVAGLSQQIASALYMVMKKMKSTDQTSRVGNLIILGAEGSGKSTLGIRFAKTISEEKGEESVKIAKIYAEDFNKKDIPSTVAKIAGGTLIIEEAGDLDEKHPDFAEKFTSEIVIPVFTNDELVEFGRTYAYEEDYTIDEEAIPTLYDRISELQEAGRPVTVIDVKEIVDEAIRQSEKIGFRKLSMVLSKKRYDADDRVILYEKDFR